VAGMMALKRADGANATPGDDHIDLEAMLRAQTAEFSPSEQTLAAYMLDNLQLLPFETGISIARAVGVSEMTVTRFVRGLGFDNLRDLKSRMRKSVADRHGDIDDYAGRFQMRSNRQDALKDSMRRQLDAVVKAYALTESAVWDNAVSALAHAGAVHVVGFQASKGLALDFASRLLWARPGVAFADNHTGTFGEIFTADPKHSLVVLVDTAAYAARAVKLAELLRARGTPLIVVTDKYSHWARKFTPLVFEGHTQVGTFWDSLASLAVILNLMTDCVAVELGPQAQRAFADMSDLGDLFGDFFGGIGPQRKD
jgi:DNA-binding MurR/RpiR family transcriptional regulator